MIRKWERSRNSLRRKRLQKLLQDDELAPLVLDLDLDLDVDHLDVDVE
jgi:hypothetical protein